ncbi:hypothetical protein CDD83_3329 [Cordyceps sp. RAO-2017]|nr:hypothetical protein CDD83_3329 [Cordyceps sp. RAO-2017]
MIASDVSMPLQAHISRPLPVCDPHLPSHYELPAPFPPPLPSPPLPVSFVKLGEAMDVTRLRGMVPAWNSPANALGRAGNQTREGETGPGHTRRADTGLSRLSRPGDDVGSPPAGAAVTREGSGRVQLRAHLMKEAGEEQRMRTARWRVETGLGEGQARAPRALLSTRLRSSRVDGSSFYCRAESLGWLVMVPAVRCGWRCRGGRTRGGKKEQRGSLCLALGRRAANEALVWLDRSKEVVLEVVE